jgi:hypothetical protein
VKVLPIALVLAGCGFDVRTPALRLEFIDSSGRTIRPKSDVEITIHARFATEGAAAEVFETKNVELAAGNLSIAPMRLAHDSGSDPSLEIVIPDDGEVVSADDRVYQCRTTVQVSSDRLASTLEQKVRVGCEEQPNRIREASFRCEDGKAYLELRGTFAELRKVGGAQAFTDDIAATMRAKLRFADERAPFSEILLQFSRTKVIAGVADAKHVVKAVAYTMPAKRDFRFPDVLSRLERGVDAGFASSEDPRAEDQVGKVMPKTRCRGDECTLRFLWPVIPAERREAEVSVHLDRAGRVDPTFRITVAPCEAPPPAADAGPA